MPLYDFRCDAGHLAEAHYALAAVPPCVDCRVCGEPARRLLAAPHLGRSGSSAYRLIEQTSRSAHEPAVVRSTGPGSGSPARYTADPLHRALPRP